MTGDARLEGIRERVGKAMDGPWEAKWLDECQISPHVMAPARSGDGIYTICTPVHSAQPQMWNMEFIAACRQDVPWLLSLIDAAKGMAEAINGNQGSDGDCCKSLATFTKLLNEETTR